MSHIVTQVVVGDRGRLVLPAAVRAQLGVEAGSKLVLSTEDDGSVRLRPYGAVAQSLRGRFAPADGSDGPSLVDELIAGRRAEAARESADDAQTAKRAR